MDDRGFILRDLDGDWDLGELSHRRIDKWLYGSGAGLVVFGEFVDRTEIWNFGEKAEWSFGPHFYP